MKKHDLMAPEMQKYYSLKALRHTAIIGSRVQLSAANGVQFLRRHDLGSWWDVSAFVGSTFMYSNVISTGQIAAGGLEKKKTKKQ
jgi:hypothetical protein